MACGSIHYGSENGAVRKTKIVTDLVGQCSEGQWCSKAARDDEYIALLYVDLVRTVVLNNYCFLLEGKSGKIGLICSITRRRAK